MCVRTASKNWCDMVGKTLAKSILTATRSTSSHREQIEQTCLKIVRPLINSEGCCTAHCMTTSFDYSSKPLLSCSLQCNWPEPGHQRPIIQFWQSIVVDSAMATPLTHYAGAVLLACPSSCDTEGCRSTQEEAHFTECAQATQGYGWAEEGQQHTACIR